MHVLVFMRKSDPSGFKKPLRSVSCLVTRGCTSCLTVVNSSFALRQLYVTGLNV